MSTSNNNDGLRRSSSSNLFANIQSRVMGGGTLKRSGSRSATSSVSGNDEDFLKEEDISNNKQNKMSTKTVTATATTTKPVATPVPVVTTPVITPEPEEEPSGFEVASKVYEGVKNLWTWGKETVPVASHLMGFAEAVASKVVETATSGSVKEVGGLDVHLKPLVSHVDKDVVDPALIKFREVFGPVMETAVPSVIAILKQISFGLIKDENNTPASGVLKIVETSDKITVAVSATQ